MSTGESEETPPIQTPPDEGGQARLNALYSAIIELLRTGADPGLQQAQRMILRRIALQGDVAPSRLPQPRNITEIGGYLNLLDTLDEPATRLQMIAGALGVAGPLGNLDLPDLAPLLQFVVVPNDRPEGDSQRYYPTHITIRSDLLEGFLAAREDLHQLGCQLPLLTMRRILPSQGRIDQPPTSGDVQLGLVGRVLQAAPGSLLVNPVVDPLAIGRRENTTEPLQLLARVLDGTTTVPTAGWQLEFFQPGVAARQTTVVQGRYISVVDVLQSKTAWREPPQGRASEPRSPTDRGTVCNLYNTEGLFDQVTQYVEELRLLYPPNEITSSVFAKLAMEWRNLAFAFVPRVVSR
jgi:hypothetical protein